jgi:hypothetical protein
MGWICKFGSADASRSHHSEDDSDVAVDRQAHQQMDDGDENCDSEKGSTHRSEVNRDRSGSMPSFPFSGPFQKY